MRYRKLRIAWSVFWGLAAVMLAVLWVRSYWSADAIFHFDSSNDGLMLESNRGFVSLTSFVINAASQHSGGSWHLSSYPINEVGPPTMFEWNLSTPRIFVPHWIVIAALTVIGVVSILPWRFSLRTLLISMTVIAILLGLVVWSIR